MAFGGHGRGSRASDLPRRRTATADHLGDPRAAWPAERGQVCRARVAMYRRARRRRRPRGSVVAVALQVRLAPDADAAGDPPRRRWAKHRDLAPLRVQTRRRATHAGTPRSDACSPPSPGSRRSSSRRRRRARRPGSRSPRSSNGTGRWSRQASRPTCCATRSAAPRATRRGPALRPGGLYRARRAIAGRRSPVAALGWRASDRRTG